MNQIVKKGLLAITLIIFALACVWYLIGRTNIIPPPFSKPTPTPEIKETAEDKIESKKGDNFSIVLGSNFSTGYEWEFDYDSNYVELADKKFKQVSHEPGMTGFGETGTYIFRALKSGKTQITASYLRPWEKDVPPQEIKLYQVKIN